MDQKEKDILDKLQAKTDEINVPDSLKPEQIEKKLEGKKQKKWNRSYTYGLAAACCIFVIGTGAFYSSGLNKELRNGSNMAGEKDIKENNEDTSSGKKIRDTIAGAESYEDIYNCFKAQQKENGMVQNESSDTAIMDSSSSNGMEMSAKSDSVAGGSYSDTNVRQEGVAEGDIVKTDGKYLYVLKENNHEISIVDTTDVEMEEVGTIVLAKDEAVSEIYIQDQRLIALYTKTEKIGSGNDYSTKQYTGAATYDISNPQKAKKLGNITQSGVYTTSRLTDGYLYLFSDYYVYNVVAREQIEDYIPYVAGKAIDSSKIYLPPMETANRYTVVSSVKLDDPDKVADGRAILAKGGNVYVSNQNIYMYETEYNYGETGNVTNTTFRKIAYNKGALEPVAVTEIAGTLNDTFSIDEYEGNLRIVATVEESVKKSLDLNFGNDNTNTEYVMSNSLYILDDSLEMIGKIEDLAVGEQIYSARLLGDTGYFVTFKQVDPLFSVDLSDPKNPEILGELKIPGFSEYLHFYGENLLLGIGQAIDEEGVASEGIKLSMFDISDPSDVKEIHKYVIENAYSTDVFYDYKAALIDIEKNMIGFSAYSAQESYYLFSYDAKNGFKCAFNEEVNGNSYKAARGIYINDSLYVVKGNIIESYSLKDYKKIDDIIL